MEIPDPPERLVGERVELRPIADWDIPEILIAHQDDRDLAACLGMERPPSGAELGREVEEAAAAWAAGLLKLTIVEPGSNDCRGRLVIDLREAEGTTAPVTVWIARDRRGRSIASEALGLARDWLARSGGIAQLQCREDRPRRG
ncbi:MAG TPA: GNAT family N-acetyltransferase [Solirubrobacteraceae bacterium]|nr:GNAT family N-acetyltransferase [Solirubrobacteraceae bacterium]